MCLFQFFTTLKAVIENYVIDGVRAEIETLDNVELLSIMEYGEIFWSHLHDDRYKPESE